jgi:hypothetical protein
VYVGGTVTLSATASSGLAVSYVSVYPNAGICTVTDTGGVWTVNLLAAGTCSIEAEQWGNSTYNAAPFVFQNFYIHLMQQTVNPLGSVSEPAYSGGNESITLGSNSSVATTFSATSNNGICTANVSGNTLTVSNVAKGICAVTVIAQANAQYSASAPVTLSFAVEGNPQTITFPAITEPVYVGGSVTPAATASSNLAVSYVAVHPAVCTVSNSGGAWTINLVAVGECSVEAQQGGSSTYASAPFVFQNFYVHLMPQTITPFSFTGTAVAGGSFNTIPQTSSGLLAQYASLTPSVCTVQYFGSYWTFYFNTRGACTIEATAKGNAVYAPAPPLTQTIQVQPKTQTITFPAIVEPVYVGGTVTPAATASSGLAVSYVPVHPAICTVSNSGGVWTINLVAVGECSVEAQQGGSSTYASAPFVFQNFYAHTAP